MMCCLASILACAKPPGRQAVWLLVLFASLRLCASALAATYYLSPTGSDANAGSEAQPWGTLSNAVLSLSAGDTLQVRGGRFTGIHNTVEITDAGTLAAPTTIRNYPGELPVFENPTTISFRYTVISGTRLTNWVFSGLMFSNVVRSMLLADCRSNRIEGCVFTKMSEVENGYAGVNIWGTSQFNIVRGNTFTNWGHFTVDPEDANPCIIKGTHLYLGNGVGNQQTWHNLVESNLFTFGAHDLLQVDGAYNVIRRNTFMNAPFMPTNADCQTMFLGSEVNFYGKFGARHIKPGDGDADDGQVDQRQVWEDNIHLYTGPPGDGTRAALFYEIATQFGIYRRNQMAYSIGSAVYFSCPSSYGRSRSNFVYGNSIFKGGLGKPHGSAEMASYFGRDFTFQNTTQTNNFIVNNIAFANYQGVVLAGEFTDGLQVWQSNLFNIDPKFYSTNVGTIDTIAGFLACAATNATPDLRINTNSPAVDAGAWLAVATNTSSGTTLPLSTTLPFSDGNRIVEGDLIQLQWSTNTARVLSNDWENAVLHLDSSLSWTNGQGVSLPYAGIAPDIGYFESDGTGAAPPPDPDPEPPPASTNSLLRATTVRIGTLTIP